MKNKKKQKGFMLVGTFIVSIVLMILVFAVVRYGTVDADMVTRSKVQANLQSALDAGLDRAINILNTGTYWNAPTTIPGFNSLSGTPYTEVPRINYYVMILDGAKDVPFSSKQLTDVSAQTLTNTGDLFFDRTVLIRAVDTFTNINATALGTIHRNNVVPPQVLGGITSVGTADLNNMNFGSYSSCTPTAAPGGCSGTVMGNPPQEGTGNCLPLQTPSVPLVIPTVAVPTSNVTPMPGNTLVTENWSAGGGGGTTIYAGTYQCANFSMAGSHDLYIDTCGGPVHIYVTGTFNQGGSGNITSGCPPTGPGHPVGGNPVAAVFYVRGNSVSLNGTGTYEILLVAPTAAVAIAGGGNGSFYGAIVSASFAGGSSSGFDMNFDTCLLRRSAADSYSRPPVVTARWKIIP